MLKLLVPFLLVPCLAFAGDWNLARMEGRDYVPVSDIAKFYSLRPVSSPSAAQGGMTTRVSYTVSAAPATTPSSSAALLPGSVQLRNSSAKLQFKPNSREITINGSCGWLSFPVKTENGQMFVSRMDLAKMIDPILRPENIPNIPVVKTVVLDPGHGGYDRGAVNRFGDEKSYTLDVCRRLKPLLEAQGLRVVMTRNSDEFVSLQHRSAMANAITHSVFVSVHFNAASTNASGVEVFSITPRGAPSTAGNGVSMRDYREEPGNVVDVPSAALASSVHQSLLGHYAQFDRGLKRARFAVIRQTRVPAILIEGGFLSNLQEAKLIQTTAWRQRFAESIAGGILEFNRLARPLETETAMAKKLTPKPSTGVQ